MKLTQVGLLGLLAFMASGAQAAKPVFVETYDIPKVECDGLTLDGVTYSFTVAGSPSSDCNAGTLTGPGVSNNVSPPNIEGAAAGVLHLTFDKPTTRFSFGVAEETHTPQTDSVIVNLNRPGVGLLRQDVTMDTTKDPGWVGGRYSYDGPAVKTVTIQFKGVFNRFAVDNVGYSRQGSAVK